jgi:hypothetical protein
MRIGGSQAITRLTSPPVNSLISLVVETAEDEIDIALLYKKVLEERNHQITITSNGFNRARECQLTRGSDRQTTCEIVIIDILFMTCFS